ncbi:MAG: signal peptidase I [Candidatus Methanoperedens sp.]|nr:signal peptidase I [Candidatus Methanoperedens sp.]
MYIPLNEILFFGMLLVFLIIVYRRVIYNTEFFEPIKSRYLAFDRKNKINNYIKTISMQPADTQKGMLKEGLILTTVLLLMFLLASKAVFFTAVVSGSMTPTFERGDMVLMQNIDRTYRVGDIIMFTRPDTSNPESHRIVSITSEGIQTQGDAVGIMDYWVIKDKEIIGKAITLEGKPVVIKGYGRFFIVDYINKNQDFGPFGQDAQKYIMFVQIVKLYGYVIAVVSLLLYIVVTVRKKPQLYAFKSKINYEKR